MLPGGLRNEICWELRGIGERFVEPVGNFWNHVEHVGCVEPDLGMVGVQMIRDLPRDRGFVVRAIAEADGEGANLCVRLGLHQRDNSGGVDAARQECADRNVGHHAAAHGVTQQCIDCVYSLTRIEICGATHGGRILNPPIAFDHRGTAGPNAQDRTGLKLVDVAEYGRRRGHIAIRDDSGHGIGIDVAPERRMRHQRPQFGTEQERAVLYGPVKRLHADTIAHQMQSALAAIEYSERKHADEALHCLEHTPLHEGGEHHFGIGCAAKAMTEAQ